MLLSGLWKLAAMASVIGVGLVAVYQAQQGMDKPAVTSTEGESGDPDELGTPDSQAAADPFVMTPDQESPFSADPFGKLGLGENPAKTASKGPTLAPPSETTEAESPFNRTPAAPTVVSKARSGPGIDFRDGDAASEGVDDAKSSPLEPVAFEEGKPARLPDDLNALEQELLKSTGKPAEEAGPARQPAVQPFVRQAQNKPEPTADTETDPFATESVTPAKGSETDPFGGSESTQSTDPPAEESAVPADPGRRGSAGRSNTPAADPDFAIEGKDDKAIPIEAPPETDPFDGAPKAGGSAIPDPADELGEPAPMKTAPRRAPASDVDPFDEPKQEPVETKPAPKDKPPLSLPDDTLSSPFDANEEPAKPATPAAPATPARPTTPEPVSTPDDEPAADAFPRRNIPRLPTEVPDSLNDSNPSRGNDLPGAPDRLPGAPPTGRQPVNEPDPVPTRRPADRTPKTLDNDLFGDGTVNSSSPRGLQQTRLTIEKIAPQQATLGEPLVYSVIVKNVGPVDATQVIVEDRIPKGTELSGTAPRAEMTEKRLIWRIGTLRPNEEKKISIRVIPRQEGPVGSVAKVSFSTEVAAEILVAAPQLSFNVKAPRQARVGEAIELTFLLKNTGSAAATNVSVRDLVPAGLKHEASADIECPIGKLAPNESREIVLTVTAVKPGRAVNRAILSTDAGINQELESVIDVVGETLVLTRSGQTRIYIDRPTQFTNNVRNDGTTAVKQVRVAEVIPAGMEFVEASDGGQYDPAQRAIFWDLGALPPGAEAAVSSKLIARAPGLQQAKITATGAAGSTAAVKSDVDVVGRPELQIETVSRTGVAVGDRLTSKIQLKNHGSAAAKNVSLSIRLPRELKLIEVRGGKYALRDHVITFESVPAINPNGAAAFELVMEAEAAAEAQMNLEISADHLSRPARRSETVQIAAEIR